MKHSLLYTVSAITCSLMLSATMPAHAAEYTDAEIKAYIDTHTPEEVAAKMKETGIKIDRVQKAAGATDQQAQDYVTKSGNTYLQNEFDKSQGQKFSKETIANFVNTHDAATGAAAAEKYGITADRIKEAVGATDAQAEAYIKNSGSTYLQETYTGTAVKPPTATDPAYAALPDFMKGTNGGQPAALIRSAADIDKLPIWSTMDAKAADFYKQKLKLALESSSETGGSYMMGVGGLQISIPGRNDPQHEYPPMSAKDLTALKDKLNSYAASGAAVQKNLVDCVQSGKADCSSERQAHALMRANVSDLQAQISAAEADKRIRATTDPEKKLQASIDASVNAENAYLACTAAASQTGSDCSAQAELAKKQLMNMKTSSRDVVNQCVSDFGAESAKCAPLYAQAHAQESNLDRFMERVDAFEQRTAGLDNTGTTGADKPPVTITVPATGEKTLADGHTVNADGVIKDASGKVVAKISENGTLVGADGKTLTTATTDAMVGVLTGTTAATSGGTKPAEPQNTYTSLNKDQTADLKKINADKLLRKDKPQTQPVTNKQIDEFIRANLSDPKVISDAMAKYGVDLTRIQKATGYSRDEMIDYINKSGDPALLAALKNWKAPATQQVAAKPVTNAEVDGYIRSNLSNPAAIAAAMKKYDVNLDRIQDATKYSHQEMVDYIKASGNPDLLAALANWGAVTPSVEPRPDWLPASKQPLTPVADRAPMPTMPQPKPQPVANTEVNAYVKANLNDPAKIAAAMKQYNVGLNQIQEATGYTREQMVDYIEKSGNADLKAARGNWEMAPATSTTSAATAVVTNADVDGYIRANLNDPAKIAAAMEKHNVDLTRIQKATGYTPDEMRTYIANSNNPALKAKAAVWQPAQPTQPVAPMADKTPLPTKAQSAATGG